MTTLSAARADGPRDREWWRVEARRRGTDWSSLLRQRIRVRWWIKAGRPPFGEWMRSTQALEE
jgi:hypothetical protein